MGSLWHSPTHLSTEVIPPTLSSAPDYYNVLGLSRDATEQEVIKAWRKAVLLHHPDKQLSNQSSSTPSSYVDIRLINEAKWILSDEKRRKGWEEVHLNSSKSNLYSLQLRSRLTRRRTACAQGRYHPSRILRYLIVGLHTALSSRR